MNTKVLGLLAILLPILVTGSYLVGQKASASGVAISSKNLEIQTPDTPQLPATWMQAKAPDQSGGSDCNPICQTTPPQ